MKMDSVAGNVQQKSTFFKKAKGCDLANRKTISSVEMDFQSLDIGTTNDFKFNFTSKGDCEDTVKKVGNHNMEGTKIDAKPSEKSENADETPQPPINYFRMDTGGSSDFKFNFFCSDEK